MLREIRDGVREVTSRTWLWVTILVANAWLLVADGPFAVLGPTLGEQRYGDTAVFGVVISVFGAGLIAGSVLGGRLSPRRPLVAGYAGLVPVSLAYVAFGLGIPLALALACTFVGGIGAATFDVLWYTSLAQQVPPEALSRVTSLDWMGSMASLPLTYLAAGTVADALGAREVIVAGGSLSLLLVACGLTTAAVRGFTLRGPAAASRSSAELPDPPVPAVPR
jgi:MFS family permease